MSSHSGPGERAEALGIRRPVELPKADIEEAEDLAPADDAEPVDGAEPAHEGGRSATEEKKAGETQERPKDTPSAAKEQEDPAPDTDVAVAAAPQTDAVNDEEMPPGRPNKPVLAAVAIGGAVLLAVPVLLIGTGSRHARKHPASAAADRVLSGNGRQPPPGAYTPMSPSATPTSTSSAHTTRKPAAAKSAEPKASGKPSPRAHASHKGGPSGKAARKGVPAGEKPMSGGNPWALEVHAPFDIGPGKTLRTNRLALTMQSGGDLVLRDTSSEIIWSTGTHHAGAYAEFQTDGNLVVYVNGRQAVWASGTSGHDGATLVLQADDNMVIYNGHDATWATNTNR